jgi:hypothetical protein
MLNVTYKRDLIVSALANITGYDSKSVPPTSFSNNLSERLIFMLSSHHLCLPNDFFPSNVSYQNSAFIP